MRKLLSCQLNIDTACVELKFADGSIISIDYTAVENEVAKNMYQRSELDWLVYNDPVGYADLILSGDPEEYLKNVTDYLPLDCKRQIHPTQKRATALKRISAAAHTSYVVRQDPGALAGSSGTAQPSTVRSSVGVVSKTQVR